MKLKQLPRTMYKQSTILLLSSLVALLLACCDKEDRSAGQGSGTEQQNPTGDTSSASTEPSGHEEAPVNDDRLIVPGERIGKTHIGESLEEANKVLGPADSGDAGMGHVWQYRHSAADNGGKPHELDIYASFDEEGTGHYIRHIRITSPWFVTQEGIRSGSSLREVTEVYPDIQPIAEYEEGATYVVYDDPREGIGFEFMLGKDGEPTQCTGIIVHEPGREIVNAYIPRHNYKELGGK